ncbi:MAG TPA: hypothetical protein VGD56_14000, partial [Gemmatirosa sp.]
MRDGLTETQLFVPADSGASDITVRLSAARSGGWSAVFASTATNARLDSILVPGERSASLTGAAVGARVARHLVSLASAPHSGTPANEVAGERPDLNPIGPRRWWIGGGGRPGGALLSRDTVVQRARRALCLGTSPTACEPSPTEAVALLSTLATLQQDAEVLALLGHAAFARGDLGAAAESLQRALALLGGAQTTFTPGPDASPATLHSQLAAVYRAAGNLNDALRQYEAVLTLAPDDTTAQRGRLESLRLAGRGLDVVRLAASMPSDAAFGPTHVAEREAARALESLPSDVIADSLGSITALCRRDRDLAAACAAAFARSGLALNRTGAAATRVQPALLAAVEFGISAPNAADVYGLLAAIALGHVTFPRGTDGMLDVTADGTHNRMVRDTIARYLARAESALSGTGSAQTREWLLRLRALSAGEQGRYVPAFRFAEAAY